MANTDTVQVIFEGHDQKMTLLKELETRLQTLEADSGRNVKEVQKQAEKAESKLQMLYQMLNDRLTPLEQLRTYLNQRASTREENIKKLSQVIQEVAVMSPRLHQLEVKSSRTRCVFTAGTSFSEAETETILASYDTLDCNIGENFDEASGIFTAAVDGLYVASISLYLDENGGAEVGVRYNKQGQGQSSSTPVCETTAQVKDQTACNLSVVEMKAGDTLHSYVYQNKTDNWKTVNFTCFLLA